MLWLKNHKSITRSVANGKTHNNGIIKWTLLSYFAMLTCHWLITGTFRYLGHNWAITRCWFLYLILNAVYNVGRYKFTLFNELYFLVAGGTVWIGIHLSWFSWYFTFWPSFKNDVVWALALALTCTFNCLLPSLIIANDFSCRFSLTSNKH